MAIHGITWLYMAIHGNTWRYMAVHGYTWLYMTLHGSTWLYRAIHSNTFQYMTIHGYTSHCMAIRNERGSGTTGFCRTFLSTQISWWRQTGTKVALRTCWHWSCASTFCKNSWKTPNVEYYTLTKVGSAPKTVRDAYLKVLGRQKEDVNFKKQVICSMHWSCAKKLNFETCQASNLLR